MSDVCRTCGRPKAHRASQRSKTAFCADDSTRCVEYRDGVSAGRAETSATDREIVRVVRERIRRQEDGTWCESADVNVPDLWDLRDALLALLTKEGEGTRLPTCHT